MSNNRTHEALCEEYTVLQQVRARLWMRGEDSDLADAMVKGMFSSLILKHTDARLDCVPVSRVPPLVLWPSEEGEP